MFIKENRMLEALPKKKEWIFAGVQLKHSQQVLKASRRKLAGRLDNFQGLQKFASTLYVTVLEQWNITKNPT